MKVDPARRYVRAIKRWIERRSRSNFQITSVSPAPEAQRIDQHWPSDARYPRVVGKQLLVLGHGKSTRLQFKVLLGR